MAIPFQAVTAATARFANAPLLIGTPRTRKLWGIG